MINLSFPAEEVTEWLPITYYCFCLFLNYYCWTCSAFCASFSKIFLFINFVFTITSCSSYWAANLLNIENMKREKRYNHNFYFFQTEKRSHLRLDTAIFVWAIRAKTRRRTNRKNSSRAQNAEDQVIPFPVKKNFAETVLWKKNIWDLLVTLSLQSM